MAPRREGDAPELVADPTRSIALLQLEFRHSRTLEEIVASAWEWRGRKNGAVRLTPPAGPISRGRTFLLPARGRLWAAAHRRDLAELAGRRELRGRSPYSRAA
jgi:hypothetical protein